MLRVDKDFRFLTSVVFTTWVAAGGTIYKRYQPYISITSPIFPKYVCICICICICPAGALRRRLLHRNGTFVPPAPSTRLRRQVKTDFRRKWAVAGPFFHQSGQFQGVRRPKFRCGRSRQFDFSRCPPETGRFGRFSGPRGPKWSVHFWYLTQKERCTG